MKKIALSLLPALVLVLGAFSQAQAKPNFSGEWKINADKSNFGPMPAPAVFDRKIEHDDPKLHVVTKQAGPQGERTSDANYTTDGAEVTNKMGEMEAKSTAVWDGDALTLTTRLDIQGNKIEFKEKWTLSEDGKTINSTLHIVSPQGEFDGTIVLVKQ
jgi:hypothetical protein